jgi:thiol-disulfide isomerase/thioredoxin
MSRSPAQKAGLRKDDIIRAIDGVEIKKAQQVSLLIGRRAPGSELTIALCRNGTDITEIVHLSARPNPSATALSLKGKAAPPFVVTLFESAETRPLDDYRGKVLLLEFWATWCGPCIKAIPGLNDVRDRFSEEDLAIVAVSNEGRTVLGKFVRKTQVDYTIALSEQTRHDYWVRGISTTFLIDTEGIVRWGSVGSGTRTEQMISREIEPHWGQTALRSRRQMESCLSPVAAKRAYSTGYTSY